MESIYKGVVHH